MLQVREFLFRLALCPGLTPLARYRLWKTAEKKRNFNDIYLLSERSGISVNAQTTLQNKWHSLELKEIVQRNLKQNYITIVDPEYPVQLQETFCPPLVLFYQGNINLLKTQSLAIVGSRQMSGYSRAVLKELVPKLVKKNITIVSGLAAGVDGLSHEITLECYGSTIGVIGAGLNCVYPRHHVNLQAAVSRQGLLISEYGIDTPPLAWHFPERNRIIAGLAETLLVVEAKKHSGSLITANIALNENRNVCAIPGRIDSPLSQGCNELISAGAKPIIDINDLLSEFH
ncbi:DNA-processing protein DprA [Lactobacillaceae bacterium 24-114]